MKIKANTYEIIVKVKMMGFKQAYACIALGAISLMQFSCAVPSHYADTGKPLLSHCKMVDDNAIEMIQVKGKAEIVDSSGPLEKRCTTLLSEHSPISLK